MTVLMEEIQDFFEKLTEFSKNRHYLLVNFAKGKTAPLAAELALREQKKAEQILPLVATLTANEKTYITLGDLLSSRFDRKEFKEQRLLERSASLEDFLKVVKALGEANEWLRRDVLMDSIAIEAFDNKTHREQLEMSEYLHHVVGNLLKQSYQHEFYDSAQVIEEPLSPWMRESDTKTADMLKQYAVTLLKSKLDKQVEEPLEQKQPEPAIKPEVVLDENPIKKMLASRVFD